MSAILKAGYVIDESRWHETNARGETYRWAYIEEVLDRLGLTAEKLGVGDLHARLHEFSLLIIGDIDVGRMPPDLARWVEGGGSLIASKTDGLDFIFGNSQPHVVPQPDGEYSVSGNLRLSETDPLTSGIRHPRYGGKPVPVFSDLRLVSADRSVTLGTILDQAAITINRYGSGLAVYFGFDLAAEFWIIQQGRPVDADHDGDGYLRTGDALVTGDYEPEIPYTDELLLLLSNIVGTAGIPLVCQLPPVGDKVPDALFFYGGDDEGSTGVQIPAAEFMAERGLPYHINCMLLDGRYGLTRDEIRRLDELRTELAPHFNYVDGFPHPCGFSWEDVRKQGLAFIEYFGRLPVSSNNHWCRWSGYSEPAQWLAELGIRADNSWAHRKLETLNPVDTIGFAFGTAFPVNIYTDATAGNRRTGVLALPITAYEVGYTGESTDFPTLDRALDLAVHYSHTMNFFFHPVYIATLSACRAAIDHLLEEVERRRLTVAHSAPDALTRWWNDRSATVVERIQRTDSETSFLVRTPSPSGAIVGLHWQQDEPPPLSLPHRLVRRGGTDWLMIVVPHGETHIKLGYR